MPGAGSEDHRTVGPAALDEAAPVPDEGGRAGDRGRPGTATSRGGGPVGRRRRVWAVVAAVAVVASSCGLPAVVRGSSGDGPPPLAEAGPSLVTTTDAAPFDEPTLRSLQGALDDVVAAGVPGALALVRTPRGTWTGTAGTAGVDRTDAPTLESSVPVGGVTKTMTATVLLQLAEESVLDLDDPVGRWVPEAPSAWAVTLRQLATMSSGLPSFTDQPAYREARAADPERPWSPAELVDLVRDVPPAFGPGEGWAYSETNYLLLGTVVERATGLPLAAVLQQRLFGPLGMTRTSLPGGADPSGVADPSGAAGLPDGPGPSDAGGPAATPVGPGGDAGPRLDGLTADGGGAPVPVTTWSADLQGAGGVVSTVHDLGTWAEALAADDGLLSPRSRRVRDASVVWAVPPQRSLHHGYGMGMEAGDGWWGHDGRVPGYTTVVRHDDERDVTVVVVAGSDVPLGGEDGPLPAAAVAARLVEVL